jgi:hypothetical protein
MHLAYLIIKKKKKKKIKPKPLLWIGGPEGTTN